MIKVANAPCSWGVIERTYEDERQSDYAQVLDEMQATGFSGTELGDWGFMPTDPERLKDELAQRELRLVESWVNSELADRAGHPGTIERCLRCADLMAEVAGGEPVIILGDNLFAYEHRNRAAGQVKRDDSMTAEQWKIFVEGIHTVARRVKAETGLRTVIHHHGATLIEAPWEIAELMERTDPDLVGLCFDTGHYRYGGGEPVEGLKSLSERIWHVHFKDFNNQVAALAQRDNLDYNTAVGQGFFCELGKGDVDFTRILNLLTEIDYSGWVVVEQDVLPNMGSPKETAQHNRTYLQSIGL